MLGQVFNYQVEFAKEPLIYVQIYISKVFVIVNQLITPINKIRSSSNLRLAVLSQTSPISKSHQSHNMILIPNAMYPITSQQITLLI